MNHVFPFELPGATVFYLGLFVATLIVHFVFMSYVLAGSVWVLAGQFVTRNKPSDIAGTLSDWMPVMLSGAITAGVAPLLFIQILYRPQFYTANLLQFNRWMAILPVLIVLFYLAYLIKAQGDRRSLIQKVAALVSVGAVLFIAWSWSGNHVLSLQQLAVWQDHYAGTSGAQEQRLVGLRLAVWITMTFPVLSCLLMWQMRFCEPGDTGQPPGIARTASVAICGSVLCLTMVFLLGSEFTAEVQRALMSSGLPWLLMAGAGLITQLSGWVLRLRARVDTTMTRWLVTSGIALLLTGVMMARELVRIVSLGERVDFATHADAATAGGLWLFITFAVINGVAAVWCLRLVRNGDHQPGADHDTSSQP